MIYNFKEDLDKCTSYLRYKMQDIIQESQLDVLGSFASKVIEVIKDLHDQEERQSKLYGKESSSELLDALDDLRYSIEDIEWRMEERIKNA